MCLPRDGRLVRCVRFQNTQAAKKWHVNGPGERMIFRVEDPVIPFMRRWYRSQELAPIAFPLNCQLVCRRTARRVEARAWERATQAASHAAKRLARVVGIIPARRPGTTPHGKLCRTGSLGMIFGLSAKVPDHRMPVLRKPMPAAGLAFSSGLGVPPDSPQFLRGAVRLASPFPCKSNPSAP